jgi:DNA-binding response OmpR family regulator
LLPGNYSFLNPVAKNRGSFSMQTTNRGKGIVLIIDDDRMIVDLVKMAFVGDGYQVMSAQSGTELNEMLNSFDLTHEVPFDLILLDLLLPDISGEELYRLLRAHAQIAKIPIIILSAAAAVQKRIQLLKMGADDYIIKPFNVDDLLMRATVHIKLGKMRQAKNEVENRIGLLGEIARMINSSVELSQILTETIDSLKRITQVESSDIFLPEQNVQNLSVAGVKKLSGQYLSQAFVDDGNGITAHTFRTGEPCLVNDVQTDGRFAPQTDQLPGQITRSLLCVPLTVHSQVVCVLRLINKRSRSFTVADLSLVVSAANILAVALDNAYLHLLYESVNQNSHAVPDTAVSLAEEVGNPLRAVHGYLEQALQADQEPEKRSESLQMASREVARLLNAIGNK